MKILAVDLGGTKTSVALCDADSANIRLLSRKDWPSQDYESLDKILIAWKNENSKENLDGIAVGIAGPVKGNFPDQTAHATNLNWHISSQKISSLFNGIKVLLCNDMETHGWGILGCEPSQLITLNPGVSQTGSKALIAAGTGLGESIIAWNGKSHTPLGGEGGHASFSTMNDEEDELLKFLRKKLSGHVSWERILGGFDGFKNIAEFFMKTFPKLEPDFSKKVLNKKDWGSVIALAAKDDCQISLNTLRLYSTLYGREAANLALKCLPYSGLYLGGGIAPKIQTYLQKYFMDGFLDKGRFKDLLLSIPVYIVQDPDNGLKGAARALVSRLAA